MNPTPKQTVLLVDDERNLVRVLEARLRREGYDTVSAFDGADALTLLRRHPVNVVVMDVQMSGLSGAETLMAMHAIRPDLPVVLMSAYGRPEGLPACVTYLEKPFNLDMLVSSVANALTVRRSGLRSLPVFALFVPGQSVRFVAPDGDGLCYGSGYIQAETGDALEVDAPVKDGRVIMPPSGSAVRVTVTGRDAVYSFNTRVHGEPSIPGCIALAKPDVIERHQRRAAVRRDVRLPVALDVVPPEDRGRLLHLSSTWQSMNVSDTGMMLLGEATLPPNSSVLFSLTPSDGAPTISGRARVVWDAPTADERFHMGLEFTDVSSPDRARLRGIEA